MSRDLVCIVVSATMQKALVYIDWMQGRGDGGCWWKVAPMIITIIIVIVSRIRFFFFGGGRWMASGDG